MSGSKFVAIFLGLIAAVVGGVVGMIVFAGHGALGRLDGAGQIVGAARSEARRAAAREAQQRAAGERGAVAAKQILFGDLHVHSTFSADAFLLSLPGLTGEGVHSPADACDFARHCSALDFWALTDHAESLTSRTWQETISSLAQCDAVTPDHADPDLVSFLGWEWSQVGRVPEEHFGSRNVILPGLGDAAPPTPRIRPIAARAPDGPMIDSALARGLLGFRSRHPRFHDLAGFLTEQGERRACPEAGSTTELPDDCIEVAATPADLIRRLEEGGHAALAIPHGTAWGLRAPPGAGAQGLLGGEKSKGARPRLFEVASGHGSSEEYRAWRGVAVAPDGESVCPAPTRGHLPSCWRAGEIIEERCLAEGNDVAECDERAAEARALAVDAGVLVSQVVGGESPEDWLDAGQCRDCDQPAFNYRPAGSLQHLLALGEFEEGGAAPGRFRPGVIASSANHAARPGTGYKEGPRIGMTESVLPDGRPGSRIFFPADRSEATGRAVPAEATPVDVGFAGLEWERQASFFQTGGLVAVHAEARRREAIWGALSRREVYATSGPRILLWFDLLDEDSEGGMAPMGSEVTVDRTPRFRVRAVGSPDQQAGCPEETYRALGPERVTRLCARECHHPAEARRLITRVEVVRIQPQQHPDEDVASLIDDPWKSLACPPDPSGCDVEFEDPDFLPGGRETVYYVRAYEEATPGVNAGGLRCRSDAEGRCVEVDLCGPGGFDDDCLEPHEPRAWSSPLFLDVGEAPAPPRETGLAAHAP